MSKANACFDAQITKVTLYSFEKVINFWPQYVGEKTSIIMVFLPQCSLVQWEGWGVSVVN